MSLSLTALASSRPDFLLFWKAGHRLEQHLQAFAGWGGGEIPRNPTPQRCHMLQGRGSEDGRLNFNLEKSFSNPAKLHLFLSASVPPSFLDLWEPFLPVHVYIP